MADYLAGTLVCLNVEFLDAPGGNPIDPPDARFDVIDPNGVTVVADQPTTIVVSPGQHRGCIQTATTSLLGDWSMVFKATIDGDQVATPCAFTLTAPASVAYGPCAVWPYDATCCDMPDAATDEQVETQNAIATTLLWAASGRRIGPCPVTIRPCLRRCDSHDISGPIRVNGAWRNNWCGCSDDCSCTSLCEIVLPGPVAGIQEVRIDGAVVAEDNYRLFDTAKGWRLLRVDGGCWPSCQDMTADCDADGSFCVTYLQGIPLDDLATTAVSELTCELVKACIPGCDCRLPRNIVSKTRQGVSITFDTDKIWLRALPVVAAFLDAVNPEGLVAAPSVWSPDLAPERYAR